MEKFLEVLDVYCGGGQLNLQDGTLPRTVSTIINILKVAVPILVVLFGVILGALPTLYVIWEACATISMKFYRKAKYGISLFD